MSSKLPSVAVCFRIDLLLNNQIAWLDEIGDFSLAVAGIPASKLRSLANQTMALDASALRNDTLPEKRYTLIVALLNRMRVRARDDLADMFVRRMAAIHKRASDELDVIQRKQRDQFEDHVAAAKRMQANRLFDRVPSRAAVSSRGILLLLLIVAMRCFAVSFARRFHFGGAFGLGLNITVYFSNRFLNGAPRLTRQDLLSALHNDLQLTFDSRHCKYFSIKQSPPQLGPTTKSQCANAPKMVGASDSIGRIFLRT